MSSQNVQQPPVTVVEQTAGKGAARAAARRQRNQSWGRSAAPGG